MRHLDRVIDVTYYPLGEAKNSNLKHRPMGVGVQGLSDVFQMLMMPYETPGSFRFRRFHFRVHVLPRSEKFVSAGKENGVLTVLSRVVRLRKAFCSSTFTGLLRRGTTGTGSRRRLRHTA